MTSVVGYQVYLTSDQYLAKKVFFQEVDELFTLMAFTILGNKVL